MHILGLENIVSFRHCKTMLGKQRAIGLLFGCALLFSWTGVWSQQYEWKNVQILGGGLVTGIIYSPIEKDLVYVRTDVGGVYRWNASTSTWVAITDGIARSESNYTGIISLATDPSDANKVYLATGSYTASWGSNGAIFISNDKGNTWTRSYLSVKLGGNDNGRLAGERLQVDPNLGSTLFLGTNNDGLWKSANSGTSWSRVSGFSPASVNLVLFDKSTGTTGNATQTIYVGVNSTTTGLYKSTDGGTTWAAVANQPTGVMPLRGAINGATLYLAYSDGLGPNGPVTKGAVWKYVTTATGNGWTNISPPTGQGGFGGISVDAQNPNNLIACTMLRWSPKDEIYRSTNGGASWTAVLTTGTLDYSLAPYTNASTPHWIGDVQIDPFNSSRAMFVTGYGLWATSNFTATTVKWSFEDKGLEETVPLEMVSPPSGAQLVSAIGDIDGFKHDNVDVTPSAGRLSPRYGTNTSVSFAENLPAKMVRAYNNSTGKYGSYSTNGGTSWSAFGSYPSGTTGGGQIAISAGGKSIVWSSEGSTGIYCSTNNGTNWIASTGSVTAKPIADRVNDLVFYFYNTSTNKVFISTTSGVSFTAQASNGLSGLASWQYSSGTIRTVFGIEGDIWLTAASGGLFHSTNAGVDFQKLSNVTEAYNVSFGKAAPNQSYPAVFIVGIVNSVYGFYRSDDAGATWARINDDQHQFGWINNITGDPRIYSRVYLATGGRGIIYGNIYYDCAGVEGGSATLDGCGTCSGGNTGIEPCATTITGTKGAIETDDIFNYYPNPFNESLRVEAKGKFSYVVYDVIGHSVEQGSGLNTSNVGATIPFGIYTLRVTQENSKKSKLAKILKQQ